MKREATTPLQRFFLLFLLLLGSTAGYADTRVRTVTESTTTSWYTSPWIWIGGAILFLMVLSVLLGGGSRRHSDSD